MNKNNYDKDKRQGTDLNQGRRDPSPSWLSVVAEAGGMNWPGLGCEAWARLPHWAGATKSTGQLWISLERHCCKGVQYCK